MSFFYVNDIFKSLFIDSEKKTSLSNSFNYNPALFPKCELLELLQKKPVAICRAGSAYRQRHLISLKVFGGGT